MRLHFPPSQGTQVKGMQEDGKHKTRDSQRWKRVQVQDRNRYTTLETPSKYLDETDIGAGYQDDAGRGRQVSGRDDQDDMHKAGGAGLDDTVQGEGAGLDDMVQGVGAGLDDMVQGEEAGLDQMMQGVGAGRQEPGQGSKGAGTHELN